MVVSLYICEIPDNVTREDLENLFSEIEGFLELRTKSTNDRKKIAFADFINERVANFAKELLHNFKFTKEDKGLNLKLSDNCKKSGRTYGSNTYDQQSSSSYLHQKRRHSFSDKSDLSNKKEDNNLNSHPNANPNANPNAYPTTLPTTLSTTLPTTQLSSISSIDNNNNLNPLLKLLTSQSSIIASNSINPINSLNSLNQNEGNLNIAEPNQLVDLLNNLQAVQLLYNRLPKPQPQLQLQQQSQHQHQHQKLQGNLTSSHKTSSSVSALNSFDDDFDSLSNFKRNATHIVYVEGIPVNATEREVAHIFRPFPGYRSLRLIQKDKNGDKNLICFADFENIIQSTICINTLQGYRFDKNDLVGLRFSYGVSKNRK